MRSPMNKKYMKTLVKAGLVSVAAMFVLSGCQSEAEKLSEAYKDEFEYAGDYPHWQTQFRGYQDEHANAYVEWRKSKYITDLLKVSDKDLADILYSGKKSWPKLQARWEAAQAKHNADEYGWNSDINLTDLGWNDLDDELRDVLTAFAKYKIKPYCDPSWGFVHANNYQSFARVVGVEKYQKTLSGFEPLPDWYVPSVLDTDRLQESVDWRRHNWKGRPGNKKLLYSFSLHAKHAYYWTDGDDGIADARILRVVDRGEHKAGYPTDAKRVMYQVPLLGKERHLPKSLHSINVYLGYHKFGNDWVLVDFSYQLPTYSFHYGGKNHICEYEREYSREYAGVDTFKNETASDWKQNFYDTGKQKYFGEETRELYEDARLAPQIRPKPEFIPKDFYRPVSFARFTKSRTASKNVYIPYNAFYSKGLIQSKKGAVK